MLRSENRILTTHAGSLPRTPELLELLVRQSRRERVDPGAFERAVEASTRHVIERQVASGVDVGNDGEQPRESFFTYVQHRMTGFGGESDRPPTKDMAEFRGSSTRAAAEFGTLEAVSLARPRRAIGAIQYADREPLDQEIRDYRRLLAEQPAPFPESFMTAPSPGIIAAAMTNDHYATFEEYIRAVAEALRVEYEAIAAQGYVLQIDAPDLARERHCLFAERPLRDFLEFVELTIDAINRSLANVPPDRARLHVCWGNYEGPHIYDVPLEDILPLLYQANVGGIVLPFANPRHAHEYRVFERLPLPDDWLLVAGVIDTTTNYVEHPEVVAERLENVTRVLGDPTRVLGGTDCGFDTSAGYGWVLEGVVWEKLKALRAGADLASQRIFGKSRS
ncbi:MAG: cobalamin-independent methionine synthase II family protein [Chloroflexi bacterium]|nr:cobalamin-independent methionine synthase II family protein [Chloroflexota bacterium]